MPSEAREAGLPEGTVTLVFTDIEGSTGLLQTLGDRYPAVLADHHALIRGAFARHGAFERGSAGDGLYFVFPTARAAVQAAVEGQLALAAHPWPDGLPLRDRMGLHTGEPQTATEGYVGLDVHRAARICAAGHGGQILISRTTRDLIADEPGSGIGMIDLGTHRLRSLDAPVRLYQVTAPGLARDFPPPRTADAPRNNLQLEVTSFIGREREIEQATAILEQSPLLTLTGPGGVGKTRLGLRLARLLLGRFEDGVWLVECGALTDPDLVLPTVVSRLRPDRADRPVAAGDRGRPPEGQATAPPARRLRPGPGRVRRAGRGGDAGLLDRAHHRHQPRGAGRPGRGHPADRLAGHPGRRPGRTGSRPGRGRRVPPVRRAGPGRRADVRRDRPERAIGGPAVPPPRRHAPGHRAGRRPRPHPAGGADRRPA